ncbi:hypothetical protein, partial [Nitrosomonas ureae]|uniref:hypothetical protein n=1 Tax=Nitrosomonas ureae TaxID=44577 RepID=UPI001C40B180
LSFNPLYFSWLLHCQARLCRNLINEFKDSEEISILAHVANALFSKGFILDQMGNYPDAIKSL